MLQFVCTLKVIRERERWDGLIIYKQVELIMQASCGDIMVAGNKECVGGCGSLIWLPQSTCKDAHWICTLIRPCSVSLQFKRWGQKLKHLAKTVRIPSQECKLAGIVEVIWDVSPARAVFFLLLCQHNFILVRTGEHYYCNELCVLFVWGSTGDYYWFILKLIRSSDLHENDEVRVLCLNGRES